MNRTTTTSTEPPARDQRRAVRAAYSAVAALHHSPASSDVAHAIRDASAAVSTLPAGFLAEALYRLLGTVEDCHRAGTPGSARLSERWRAVSAAVRLAG
ncbi:hypothetical protein GCM10009836_50970 [Pseudonocardia ailaonensis]|uniref:Uncharacterized protein n=1 Tax=Pseudonocardia ailaonensis TaxID=367279 RepID=A0ABN2NFT2_9PSEU